MKVALLWTYSYPVALGLRYVSSFLKGAGHEVRMIFMASKRATAEADFNTSLLEDLFDHLHNSDLIGMSLVTNAFYRSGALTQVIRGAGIRAPIVWGGTHPTVAPEECLEVADVICVGEGERAMVELADRLSLGKDPKDIPGLGFRAGGPFGNSRPVINAVAPLDQDLDAYPFPDYDLGTHWVSKRGRLVPATPANLRGALHRLRVLSTRGCPNRCTFCNNTAWRKVYRGKGPWVRMRSVGNVLREIESMRRRFGSIEAVNIVDDLFFVRSEEEIAEFAAEYRARINLPLELDAFPNTLTDGKMRALSRLPIALVSMGIESASPDTLERIYQRHTPIESILRGIELLNRYRIPAEYHYLVSNPYEPDGNVVETMRFIASHHKKAAAMRVFPLMFYPGSPLSERAGADRLIGQHDERAYRYTYTGNTQFAGHDYLAVWLRMVLQLRNIGLRPGAAHRLIDFATHPLVRRALDRPWFTPLAFGLYQVGRRLVRNLVYEPFIRPLRHLRRPSQAVQ